MSSESSTTSEVVTGQPDLRRRRFLQAGVVAAPLIVTLTARPAWAGKPPQQTSTLGNYASQASNTPLVEPARFA